MAPGDGGPDGGGDDDGVNVSCGCSGGDEAMPTAVLLIGLGPP
jgi:hypothetical protein